MKRITKDNVCTSLMKCLGSKGLGKLVRMSMLEDYLTKVKDTYEHKLLYLDSQMFHKVLQDIVQHTFECMNQHKFPKDTTKYIYVR